MRPSPTDSTWVPAPDGHFIGFNEASTLPASGYTRVQFRYFRAFLYIPSDLVLDTLRLVAQGIDDSIHIVMYNSTHQDGVSPMDSGPSDAAVGVCQGNGDATWDFTPYIERGEVNMFLLVHSDMQPPTSSLASVDFLANDVSVPLFDCGAP